MNATALPGYPNPPTNPPAKLPRVPVQAVMAPAAKGATPRAETPTPLGRNAAIGVVVLALHAGVIWALQSGSALRTPELIVRAEVLAQFIESPLPQVEPAPPAPPAPPSKPVKTAAPSVPKKAVLKAPARLQPQARPLAQAQPLAIADPTPALNAPTDSLTPGPSPTPAPEAPGAPETPVAAVAQSTLPAAPGPSPAPALAAVQLPSNNADYLQNPKPAYPPLSKRLGEQGRVIARVLIGADGQPRQAELRQSSGFERLDQAALTTVMKWRYMPGKRGGVAEDMWFNVPINFVLE